MVEWTYVFCEARPQKITTIYSFIVLYHGKLNIKLVDQSLAPIMGPFPIYPWSLRLLEASKMQCFFQKSLGCCFCHYIMDFMEGDEFTMLWKQYLHSEPTPRTHSLSVMLVDRWADLFPYNESEVLRNPQCLSFSPLSNGCPLVKSPKLPVTWSPPSAALRKWNVDASLCPLQLKSSIGGVLRDHEGKFLCIFSSPIPCVDINHAEVLVIHRAIKYS